MPRRDDHGLERYNPDTNLMEIGGVGAVPDGPRRQDGKGPVRAADRR